MLIKCPFCGEESPSFDYAHVCSTGSRAVEMPESPVTPEEEEAWKELEDRLKMNTLGTNSKPQS